ncbi:protein kinase C-binding protein NELL2a-like [Haliotis cracherodii]|uniref:protein kinase C-binding protein NELL2a-like n=1 Tax=Haliotis cracherodii TaxID=6455 RepID=UPI0039ED1AB6
MIFKWCAFLFYFVFISKGDLSYIFMNESCGVDQFERILSLDGFIFDTYTLGSHKEINYLACAVDCFYNVNCLSVVFDEQTSSCSKYFTHMKDSYTRRPSSTASYLQLKDPDNCADIVVPCHTNAVCLNKRQNDACVCKPGFTGDGQTCSDVNECITGSHDCDVNADCTNIVASYSCACKPGFNGDGKTCTDENECTSESNTCDSNAGCTNSVGSYSCACKPGFNGDGKTCTDVNECKTGSNDCATNADCTNIVASYSCACKPGFNGNGKTCTDNNECSTSNACHAKANCANTYGSYTCRCKHMYEGNGVNCILSRIKGQTCTQASDCIRSNFICSSGLCDCDVGYSYDGTSNTCVIRCDNYGSEFSHQSTTYCISGYNNAIYDVNTFTECRQYCLTTSSFTCRTFELWNGACYLSSAVKTEVPDSKWAPWTGCKYYQRQCA